jgi:hypothetical protein
MHNGQTSVKNLRDLGSLLTPCKCYETAEKICQSVKAANRIKQKILEKLPTLFNYLADSSNELDLFI